MDSCSFFVLQVRFSCPVELIGNVSGQIQTGLHSTSVENMQHLMLSVIQYNLIWFINIIVSYMYGYYCILCSTVAPKANIALCVTSVFLILTIIVNGSTTVLEARITSKQFFPLLMSNLPLYQK